MIKNFAYQGPSSTTDPGIIYKLYDMTRGTVGVDVETISLDDRTPLGISFSINASEAFYFPINSPMLPWHILLNPDMEKIFHNAAFDIKVIKNSRGVEVTNYKDSMIAALLVGYPREKISLADLSFRLFGSTLTQISDLLGTGTTQLTMLDIPEEAVAKKCCQDTIYTLRLWEVLKPYVPMKALDLEMRAMPVLLDMEARGMRVDEKVLELHIAKTEKDVKYYRSLATGWGFNPGSSKQLAAIIEGQGMVVPYNRKTHNPKLPKETLQTYYADVPLVQLALLYRESNSTLTNLVAIRDKHLVHGRVLGRIHQNGADSGRVSTSKPNRQNLTPYLRDIYIPEDGEEMEEWDLNQIELRVLAFQAQDPVMMATFKTKGGDVHNQTSLAIFGDTAPHHRRIVKNINYTVVYDGDEHTLWQRYGIPEKKGKEFINSYFRLYKGVKVWIEATRKFAHANGYTETLLGRRRYHEDISNKWGHARRKAERELINHAIQGTAAEILKELIWRCKKEFQVNTAHDSIIFSKKVGHELDYFALGGLAPFRTPATIKRGPNWKDLKEIGIYDWL